MKVSDILKGKGKTVSTIRRNDTVGELSHRLREERVGVMVVSDDGRTLDGIISERDVAYGLSKRRGDLHLVKVSLLMTKKVITCTPDDPVHDAMALMAKNNVRHLVVLDEAGKIGGLLSMRDVMQSHMDRLEDRTSALKKTTAIH